MKLDKIFRSMKVKFLRKMEKYKDYATETDYSSHDGRLIEIEGSQLITGKLNDSKRNAQRYVTAYTQERNE